MGVKTDQRKEEARLLLMTGMTNKEVAAKMNIGLSTLGLYKKELRSVGIELPEFRLGKPARTDYAIPIKGWEVQDLEPALLPALRTDSGLFRFVIDGIIISVPSSAKINVINGCVCIKTVHYDS